MTVSMSKKHNGTQHMFISSTAFQTHERPTNTHISYICICLLKKLMHMWSRSTNNYLPLSLRSDGAGFCHFVKHLQICVDQALHDVDAITEWWLRRHASLCVQKGTLCRSCWWMPLRSSGVVSVMPLAMLTGGGKMRHAMPCAGSH